MSHNRVDKLIYKHLKYMDAHCCTTIILKLAIDGSTAKKIKRALCHYQAILNELQHGKDAIFAREVCVSHSCNTFLVVCKLGWSEHKNSKPS